MQSLTYARIPLCALLRRAVVRVSAFEQSVRRTADSDKTAAPNFAAHCVNPLPYTVSSPRDPYPLFPSPATQQHTSVSQRASKATSKTPQRHVYRVMWCRTHSPVGRTIDTWQKWTERPAIPPLGTEKKQECIRCWKSRNPQRERHTVHWQVSGKSRSGPSTTESTYMNTR